MAEGTNYIDRLVAELCPDGVEYRPLGDVVEYAKKREKDGTGVHLYVGVENLKSDFLGCSPVNGSKGGIIFQKDDILLGNIRPYLKKMWLSNAEGVSSPDVLVLRIQENEEENIVAKYLYYILSSSKFVAYNISHSRGGKMPRGNKAKILEFEFPVPPTEIQEAIVEILDKFTNLEVELEGELEARTLQYEYYRDSLFEALNCPRATLGELGKFYGGLKGKTKNDFGSSGARYISYKNVYENISVDFTWPDFVQVKEGENQLSLMKGDILLTGSSENMEEAGLSSVVTKEPEEEAYLNSFSICYRLNDPSILNPEFSKYLFRSRLARKQIIRTAQGVTRFNVSKKKLANVSIPIPSLEEQQRIVGILDRFDALTSSLSEGLPAELAARRSQYEYYRDQLLTFPRKGENQ
ncbi:restriction endonuclease subunit S [Rothia mucilaginosa]|uniref:restriction endonuclease subunit S n=1 Tax=Rothia mucilaginosa TaxID=43675 RepID=UPI0026F0EF51|nr:restriction endonuclease subunit S [Rothia mucilaginosa]